MSPPAPARGSSSNGLPAASISNSDFTNSAAAGAPEASKTRKRKLRSAAAAPYVASAAAPPRNSLLPA